MSGPLADALFWIAVIATATAHTFILRSTIRGMRAAAARGGVFWEWTWAVLPALALVVLFTFTWREMHPNSMTFLLPAGRIAPGTISS